MQNDPGIVCTAIAVSALNVTVRDAASGAAVCDASVIALESGGASYALRQTGDCRYAGAEERSGGFELIVTRSGYRAIRVGGIQVGRDECHVIPVQVTIPVESCLPGCDPGAPF
jgi:hypothetical protein